MRGKKRHLLGVVSFFFGKMNHVPGNFAQTVGKYVVMDEFAEC